MSQISQPFTLFFARMVLLATGAMTGYTLPQMVRVWWRMLTPLLGDRGVTLALVSTLAVLGAAGGLLLFTCRRRDLTPLALAGALIVTALAIFHPLALGDRVAALALLLQPLGDAGWRFPARAAIAAPVVLPAAVAWGFLLPAVASPGRGAGGIRVAVLAGAVLGALPALGVWRQPPVVDVWGGVSAFLLILAIEPAVRGWPPAAPRLTAAAPLALLFVAPWVAATESPTAFWRHSPIGAGLLPAAFDGANDLRRLMARQRRSVQRTLDDVDHPLALETEGCGFRLDGVPGGGLRDAPGAAMSALIGAALHPGPRRALVLGLGSGTSAGWLAAVPGMERVDVVESEPAMGLAAARCAAINRDAMDRDAVQLHHGDGRRFLLRGGEAYDLILVARPGTGRAAARLYETAARRLAAGGLLLQRAPAGDRIRSEVRAALSAVLASVEEWQVHRDALVLIAAARPPEHDFERLRSRSSREPWRRGLDWLWGVEGLEGLLAGYLGELRRAPVDPRDVDESRLARAMAWGSLPESSGDAARLAFQRGELRRALLDFAGRGEPRGPIDRLLLAEASAEFADDRVPELVEPLRDRRPVEVEAVLARWQARRRTPAAGRHLVAAFAAARRQPWVHPPTLGRALDLAVELAGADAALAAELFATLDEPFAVDLLREARQRARLAVAHLLDDPAACGDAFADFEPDVPWEERFLEDRARCYERSGHRFLERARDDLARFRRAAPPRLDAGLLPEDG